ncbi:hypothetical protein FBR06_10600 [Betaproteobacteria bacterium PRO4]|nr:hypothetical protein [Betaproteobacteria bacterium PRO4]
MHRINFLIRNLAPAFPLLFLPLFAACKKMPVQPDVPEKPLALDLPEELNTDVLVPLTVGNWWRYETTTYRLGSNEPGRKDSSMWRIHADTLLTYEGQSFTAAISGWYYEKEDIVHDTRWLYINDSAGLNIGGGITSHDTMITKYIERKYPVNVGDAWEFQELLYGIFQGQGKFAFSEYTVHVSCLATDQPFETSVGVFQCHVYHFKIPIEDVYTKREYFVYYVPGIGRVGWEERNEGSEWLRHRTALYACRVR